MADETRIVEVVVQAVGDNELKQMAAALQKLATEAEASKKAVADLNKDMNQLGTTMDKQAKDVAKASKAMSDQLAGLGGGLKKVGTLLGAGFTIKGLISASKEMQQLNDQVKSVADSFLHAAFEASGFIKVLNDESSWDGIKSVMIDLGTYVGNVVGWLYKGAELWGKWTTALDPIGMLLDKWASNSATEKTDAAAALQRRLLAVSRGPGTEPMEGVTVSGSSRDAWAEYDREQEALAKQRESVKLTLADLKQSVVEERELSAAAMDSKEAEAKVRDQIQARKELEQITKQIKEAQLANEQELIDKAALLLDIRVRTADLERQQQMFMEKTAGQVSEGIDQASTDIEASLQNFADGMGVLDEEIKTSFIDWKESASVLSHAFTQLFSGATHNARDFFRTILDGMAEVYMKKAMLALAGEKSGGGGIDWLGVALGAVGSALGGMFRGGPALKAATNPFSPSGGPVVVQPGMTVAMGNVFDKGTVHPFGRGAIVGGPMLFPMANGAGLMGEAGPEAIMPLKRGSDGKLGVAAPKQNVVIENHGAPVTATVDNDGNEMRIILRAARMGADMAVSRVNQSVSSGYGSTASSMQRTYGLRRRT